MGTYTFLINEALDIIDDIALVVASEKKLNTTCPLNRYRGKFSMSNLNKLEKTTDNTIIIQSGFNSVHNTPKTDRRYLILISLAISSLSNGLNLKKF